MKEQSYLLLKIRVVIHYNDEISYDKLNFIS